MEAVFPYNNLDRVVLEQTDTTTYEYFYDSEGNLAKKVDKTTGKAVNYQYDSLGRLIHSYQSDGSSIVQRTEHIYDTSNRISSQSWQLGNTTYSESYAYDADDGSLLSLTGAGGVVSYSFGYDALKRLAYRYNYYFQQDYTYRDISSGSQTTTQVSSIAYSQRPGGTNFSTFTLGYTYDSLGNISKVTGTNNTAQNASYTYDQQGQLTKEVNTKGTYNYTYDTYGNIRSVSSKESHTYTYGNSEWLDLLTAYDDHSINYDAIGNPTNWYNTKAWNFTWQNGRQLAKATSGSTTVSYTYDVAGIRDSKTVGSTVYNYLTQNGQVVQQSWNGNVMDFIYDENSRPYACIYKNALYYYVLNLQGDVIGLVNTSGAYVAKYAYDAWGNVISNSGTMAETNPLRYRGYYYDTETKLYYLGSRYYDPAVKRFVNSDRKLPGINSFISRNLFSYCLNTPVNMADSCGESPYGVLTLADYSAIHTGVQLELSLQYGWELEVYVKTDHGQRGFLDLYDSANHAYYEVKSAGVANSVATERQMNKYDQSSLADKTGRDNRGILNRGTQSVSGSFQYGIYDVRYYTSSWAPNLIVYEYSLNYSRAFALYGLAFVSAIILAASDGAALPALATYWSGYIYAYA